MFPKNSKIQEILKKSSIIKTFPEKILNVSSFSRNKHIIWETVGALFAKVIDMTRLYIWIIFKASALWADADFALQNMVETTLPDGFETSGRRVYR